MNQLIVESSEAIKAEGGEMVDGAMLSQSEVAKRLGVSDKTIRNWMPEIRWIYYWCEDRLIQNGQFTRQGFYAIASFQNATRSLTFSINPKTGKLNKDKSGKTKTEKNKNKISISAYAQRMWALNKVEPNSQPFVSDPTSPEVSDYLSDLEPEVIDGELEEKGNISTLMVFETRSYSDQLADISDDVTTLTQDSNQSMRNLTSSLLKQGSAEGKMLGTMVGKSLVQSFAQAKNAVVQEAFTPVSGVTDQLPKQAMKRQTTKV